MPRVPDASSDDGMFDPSSFLDDTLSAPETEGSDYSQSGSPESDSGTSDSESDESGAGHAAEQINSLADDEMMFLQSDRNFENENFNDENENYEATPTSHSCPPTVQEHTPIRPLNYSFPTTSPRCMRSSKTSSFSATGCAETNSQD